VECRDEEPAADELRDVRHIERGSREQADEEQQSGRAVDSPLSRTESEQ
jgi:hypothetical protein